MAKNNRAIAHFWLFGGAAFKRATFQNIFIARGGGAEELDIFGRANQK